MMAIGSSRRGLSDVTTTRSARRRRTAPISGRFSRSRSPPAPNTTMTAEPGSATVACRREHLGQTVRGVGVVDDHAEPVFGRRGHRLESTGIAGTFARPSAATAGSTPSSTAVTRARSEFMTLKRPPIGTRHVDAAPAVRMRRARHLDVEIVGRDAHDPHVAVPARPMTHVGEQATVGVVDVDDRRAERTSARTAGPWPGSTPRSTRADRGGRGRGW